MALRLKSSRSGASDTVKVFPDLPMMPSTLLSTRGAQEWNSDLQGFWDVVRERLWDGSLDTKRRVVKLSSEVGQLSATIETLSETAVTGSELSAAMTTTLSLASADAQARVTTEAGIRASADSSLGGSISSIQARWGVSIDVNGNVVGRIRLDGTASTSEFSVLATSFKVWDGSSAAFQVFTASGGKVRMAGWEFASGKLVSTGSAGTIELNGAASSLRVGSLSIYEDIITLGGTAIASGSGGRLSIRTTPVSSIISLGDSSSDTITLNGATGSVAATSFSGSGASLTSLNASNVSSGTLAKARLPALSTSDISGLGSMATQASSSVSITGGSVDVSTLRRSGSNVLVSSDVGSIASQSASSVSITGGTITGLTSLRGAGPGSCTLDGVKFETNPDTSGHGYFGCKVVNGSDGQYIAWDINGGSVKYVKIFSSLP